MEWIVRHAPSLQRLKMTKPIIVIGAMPSEVRKFVRHNSPGFSYVYLGEDAANEKVVSEIIGTTGIQIDIAKQLQETASKLKPIFVNYVGGFASEKNSLYWLVSRFSEKNPYVSKLFLYVCYLHLSHQIANGQEHTLVFIAENQLVRRELEHKFNLQPDKLRNLISNIIAPIQFGSRFITNKLWFVVWNCYFIFLAKYKYKFHKKFDISRPLILIHTFVKPGDFTKEGQFNSLYFGELPKYIEKKGKKPIFFPRVLDSRAYESVVEKMASSNQRFLVPHAYLTFFDIFVVLANVIFKRLTISSPPKFENIDITFLIENDLTTDLVDNRMMADLLYPCMLERFKQQGIDFERLIYTFENHAWEKVLCHSFRRFYPHTRLVGYQHSTFAPMHLNYFISQKDQAVMPFPDRIITSGLQDEKILINAGFPRNIIVRGGAIRYAYLLDTKQNKPHPEKRPTVLITSSISKSESIELLSKCYEAFKNTNYRILVKCHPYMPFVRFGSAAGISLPSNFEITNNPISILIPASDILVYSSSTTCIEALAMGVPVVHVKSSLFIDLDQLDDFPGVAPSVADPKELAAIVKSILEMNTQELVKQRKKWKEVVGSLFLKPDEKVYKLFIE